MASSAQRRCEEKGRRAERDGALLEPLGEGLGAISNVPSTEFRGEKNGNSI